MVSQFIWQIDAICQNANLVWIVPINNLRDCVGQPAGVFCVLLFLAGDCFAVFAI